MENTVRNTVVEVLASISGKFFNKGSCSYVPVRYRALLFAKSCEILRCKAAYQRGLTTINKFTDFFVKVLRRKQCFINRFCKKVYKLVCEITGEDYGLDGVIYSDILPKAFDLRQRKCEEINYSLKLGKVKTAIRNKFDYHEYSWDFYYADTVRKIAEAIYWKSYVLSIK